MTDSLGEALTAHLTEDEPVEALTAEDVAAIRSAADEARERDDRAADGLIGKRVGPWTVIDKRQRCETPAASERSTYSSTTTAGPRAYGATDSMLSSSRPSRMGCSKHGPN